MEDQTIIYDISAAQCRAARALLSITQTDLAELAGCGLSTVVDFEKARRDISRPAALAIQRALERRGIEFINDGRRGIGLYLRTKS